MLLADLIFEVKLEMAGRVISFIPVSYTHLDVYKRQDLARKGF